jgi:hypothetical protein
VHTDRRVAGGVVALAAVVFLVTIAATLGTATGDAPHEDERTIARDLLLLAARADGQSYRLDYTLTRRIAGRDVLQTPLTVWVRAAPPLVVESSNGTLTVHGAHGGWICTPIPGARPQCLPSTSVSPPTQSVVAPYAFALASGRYDVARAPNRTIAGLATRCFVLRVVPGVEPITGIGDELTLCFAPNGALLANRRVDGDTVDTRTATALRNGVSAAELKALARDQTDGSVPDLSSR